MTCINNETKKITLTGKSIDIYAIAVNGNMILCDVDGNTLRSIKTSINSELDSITTAIATINLTGLAEVN